METRMITYPTKQKGNWTRIQVPYDKLLGHFKSVIDQIPETIAAMKAADNAGFQDLLDEVTAYAEHKPELVQMIRKVDVDGKEALSIGEPNWIIFPLLIIILAFSTGVMIGYTIGYDGGGGPGGGGGPDDSSGGGGPGGGGGPREEPLPETEPQ